MRSVPILLALMVLAPTASDGYGINIELDTATGDRLKSVQLFREKVGPDFTQGIHERITEEAIDAAESRRPFLAEHPDMKHEVKVGILFNDDPAGYLFPLTDGNLNGYDIVTDSGESEVSGFKWLRAFGWAEARMARGSILEKERGMRVHVHAPGSASTSVIAWLIQNRGRRETVGLEERTEGDILHASHFGDLQYLHAMGLEGETRRQILGKMEAYSKHAWSVAIGAQSLPELKSEIERARAAKASGAQLGRRQQLLSRFPFADDAHYNTNDPKAFSYRALGSILHMIQDSYAQGHGVREGWKYELDETDETEENSGRVEYFQNYVEQDKKKHGRFDTHASQEVDKWRLIPGATTAMARSSMMVTYFTLKCSWAGAEGDDPDCPSTDGGVRGYLFGTVFATVPASPEVDTTTRSHPQVAATG